MPLPSTATGVPPASTVARCAAPSMPSARPLTTVTPWEARAAPIDSAACRPYGVQRRDPTTATERAFKAWGSPRTKRQAGGSYSSDSRGGYDACPAARRCTPIRSRTPRRSRARSAGSRSASVLDARLRAGGSDRSARRALPASRMSLERPRVPSPGTSRSLRRARDSALDPGLIRVSTTLRPRTGAALPSPPPSPSPRVPPGTAPVPHG